MVIYGSIGSRASRCLWAAEETGVPYEWNPISTLDGSSRKPDYLAINPSGKIPALSDGDVVMTESMAIVLYLAQVHGRGTLWPVEAARRASALQWTMWSVAEIEYYVGAIFPHLVMKSPEQRDQALVDRLLAEMMPKWSEVETRLRDRDYLLGAFTVADIALAVQTFTMVDRFGMHLAELPAVRDWTARCRARPARARIEALAAAARKPTSAS